MVSTRSSDRRRESSSSSSSRWCAQPLTPLMEGPELLEMQLDGGGRLSNHSSSSSSWEVVREWFRVHKNTIPNGGISMALYGGGGDGGGSHSHNHLIANHHHQANKRRQDLRLLLGVLGCPLAPIPLPTATHSPPILHRPHVIRHIPIETSTAHYIIQQYLAATGCLKKQEEGMIRIKNMYTTGEVKMVCCETEISSSSGGGAGRVKSIGRRSGENGCFVLWHMSPGMWSLELVLSGNNNNDCSGPDNDYKVMAGSDGKIVWRHTPWLGTHAAKGPHRPLRRLIQGLDPKSTARLFGEAQCLGEKRIGEEDCFVLRVTADGAAVRERNEGPAEVIRHVLYGYFSQKTGLLIYMEDSHLTRVVQVPAGGGGGGGNNSKNNKINNKNKHSEEGERVVYWETTIGSSIRDYREVDGLLIAHAGRTIATLFRFDEHIIDNEKLQQLQQQQQQQQQQEHYYSRTRMEESWRIDDVVFNVPGLSVDAFLPPSDI